MLRAEVCRFPALALLLLLGACRQDMHDAPKYEPLEQSDFFGDGLSARPLPAGTVARGHLRLDEHLYAGKVGGDFAPTFPFAVDREVLLRGKERFEIFCSPCHGRAGNGQGMVVQRGMKQPQTFHSQRLRDMPPGYFFDVMTRGFGVMYPYASRVPVHDRWAIVAYIRALQYSQNAPLQDLTEEDRRRLQEIR